MKKKTRKIGTTLVYLSWFDSSITQGEVCSPEDASGILENESAGILIGENKECITIAMDRCPKTGGLRCTLCVPKVNLRSVRRFRI